MLACFELFACQAKTVQVKEILRFPYPREEDYDYTDGIFEDIPVDTPGCFEILNSALVQLAPCIIDGIAACQDCPCSLNVVCACRRSMGYALGEDGRNRDDVARQHCDV